MTENAREQFRLVSSILKVEHRDLMNYVDSVLPGAQADPFLFAHLIAWNEKNGRIRDTKVAYPVLALRSAAMGDTELAENAIAHIVSQGPRELMRAYSFNKMLSSTDLHIRHGRRRMLEGAMKEYLDVREKSRGWWERAVVRNRKAMRALYTVSHKKPRQFAQRILFEGKYPKGSVFEGLRNLKTMTPIEAGGFVLKHKIPFTVATGAGLNLDNSSVLIALVQSMTGNELVTAAKSLKKLKAFQLGAVQDAYKEAVGKVSKDKRVSVGKATKAAAAAPEAAKELKALKEKAAESVGPVKGDWLILADRSPSMSRSIEAGKELAGFLAHRVEGKVFLCFFDGSPLFFEVSGASLDEIHEGTRHITTGSATSIGCGLRFLREKKIDVDGIVIISDGEENTHPRFVDEYKKMSTEPSVYFVEMYGGQNNLSGSLNAGGVPFTHFDQRTGLDSYALENVVKVLKPGTYGLVDDIMSTPLLSLGEVFGKEVKKNVLATV